MPENQSSKPLVQALVGFQMLFVAFGALVLVPILTGLDPNVALFTAGIGTLAFHIITRAQVPIFLASSFAFIAPIIYSVQTWGIPSTLSGLLAAGIIYILLSFLVRLKGQEIIDKILPKVVIGPVIMVIGLALAPVAVNMALGKSGDGAFELVPETQAMIVAFSAFLATMIAAAFSQGWTRLFSILFGIAVGYVVSFFFGMVDYSAVATAPWFAIPSFTSPEFNINAILFIIPVAIAPAIEHIGDVLAISKVTGKDYLKKPGLKNTLLGDGVATSLAAVFGGPPNTTYSEVTGAVTLTKMYSPMVMIYAAVFAIVISFCGKLGAILATIPTPVMGGILIILFGSIAVVGMKTLLSTEQEITEPRNMIIISVILVFGIGGMVLSLGSFQLGGVGLAAIIGILLNAVLPKVKV